MVPADDHGMGNKGWELGIRNRGFAWSAGWVGRRSNGV